MDKVFQVRPKTQRKTQDVIYTISSAIQNLEDHTSSNQQRVQAAQHEESVTQRADLIKALTRHNDSATNSSDSNIHHLDSQPQNGTTLAVGGNVKMVIQALARQFRPFNPPPAPTAAPEVEFFDPQASGEEASPSILVSSPAQMVQQTAASLRVKATTANSFFTPSFHTARRVQRGTLSAQHLYEKRKFQIRDLRRMGSLREMLLISVKRQRRLKMKKHKYKKLQRKTRNLRRRQGKI